MAAYGLSEADYEDEFPPVLIWPGNERAYDFWCVVCGQWRAGAGGAFALDYGVVITLLDRMKLPDDDRDELFEDIRIMERGALQTMQTE